MAKRKRGRPSKPDAEKKTQMVRFMVTADQEALLRRAAGAAHDDLTAWVRRVVLNVATEVVARERPQSALLDDLTGRIKLPKR